MASALGKILELASLYRASLRESQVRGESQLLTALWLLRLLTTERFSVRELYAYAPQIASIREQLPVILSKEASLRPLARLNPRDASAITEDKYLFYQHCSAHGLPVPAHLFTTGSSDPRLEQWLALCDADARASLPPAFIIKERHGAYGSGFMAFENSPEALCSSNGNRWQMSEFKALLSDDGSPALIVQERVWDHSELRALSGTRSLQCLRLVSFREKDGTIRFPFFMLKLLAAGNITDNFSGGRSGNLIAYGDKASGMLEAAVIGSERRLGLDVVKQHPDTAQPISGFKIPCWDEAQELARNAHQTLDTLTSIGWDIAITDDGPLLLEGNTRFDPPMYAPHLLTPQDWQRLFGAAWRTPLNSASPG